MEIYSRLIKAIAGNGTGSLKITPSRNKRLHAAQFTMTYAGGTNTLAALMTALTEIRVLVGTVAKWRLNGTKLRDWLLLHGTAYDFDGVPNTGCQVTLPFAPEWFLDNVADSLAWNPRILGGDITIEIDSSANLTVEAHEFVSDNLDAFSSGILTLEVIKPLAGGVKFHVEAPTLKPTGRLYSLSIYPDSTNSREITPASLQVGPDDLYAHERMTSAQNDERLARFGRTPAASGRTANVYDMTFVKGDALSRAIDLDAWRKAVLTIEAGDVMAGTCDILVARLERR